MKRELISENALREYLESKLHEKEECREYAVGGFLRLQKPDAEGCNWSPPMLHTSGESVTPEYQALFGAIVAEARLRFNLE